MRDHLLSRQALYRKCDPGCKARESPVTTASVHFNCWCLQQIGEFAFAQKANQPLGLRPNVLWHCNALTELRLAPRAGLEPAACRLTAECSTIERPWYRQSRLSLYNNSAGVCHSATSPSLLRRQCSNSNSLTVRPRIRMPLFPVRVSRSSILKCSSESGLLGCLSAFNRGVAAYPSEAIKTLSSSCLRRYRATRTPRATYPQEILFRDESNTHSSNSCFEFSSENLSLTQRMQ
jgi:hypothetical protein